MPQDYNFNVPPYNDDYTEDKNYHKVLFKPGKAVQARELTQLQTILQNQIKRVTQFLVKEGGQISGSELTYTTNADYVTVGTDEEVSNFIGKTIVGSNTGVRASVIFAETDTENDPKTLFVQYINSGNDNETSLFEDGETISTDENESISAIVGNVATETNVVRDPDNPETIRAKGKGSLAEIQSGVRFIAGLLCKISAQRISLEKYSVTPSYRVGLLYIPSIIDSDDDQSLLDNAQGTSNYLAPGADRYKVDLTLVKRALDSTQDENFIELFRLNEGFEEFRQEQITGTPILEATLATRTYEESGNYVIDPFLPTVSDATDDDQLEIRFDPGIAYIKGYRRETKNPRRILMDRARDTITETGGAVGARTINYGNYILVTDVCGIPQINLFGGSGEAFPLLNLYDGPVGFTGLTQGEVIGTARLREFTLDVDNPNHNHKTLDISGFFRAYLFDVKMNLNKSFTQVKGFVMKEGTPTNFHGSVLTELDILQTTSQQFTDIGFDAANGDPILFGIKPDATNLVSSAIRGISPSKKKLFAKNVTLGTETIFQIGDQLSQVYVYSANAAFNPQGTVIARRNVYDISENQLIFRLPKPSVKALTGIELGSVRRTFTGTLDVNGEITFSLSPSSGETFVQDTTKYLAATTSEGTDDTPSSMVTYEFLTDISLKVTLGDDFAPNAGVAVMALINKGAPIVKSKVPKTIIEDIISADLASLSTIALSNSDAYELVSITMATGFGAYSTLNEIDVTSRYRLDSGQRDGFYDLASLVLLAGEKQNTGSIRVTYRQFEHTSGDYFSIESYPPEIDYVDIPSYISTTTGEEYKLADCYDFRPTVDTSGGFSITLGSSKMEIPFDGSRVSANSFEYYVSRIDKVYIDKDGNFGIVRGVPAISPPTPDDPDDAMVLYIFRLFAYTGDLKNDIKITFIDNRRYTMRDIGRLEKRIEKLEYYTSLSLLEKETADLEIIDAETGLERSKNGFIVDPFTGHGIGNVFDPDYKIAVDSAAGELRPLFIENSVALNYNESKTISLGFVEGTDYKKNGDIITLPFTSQKLIENPYASNVENVNPYAIFTFLGNIKLTPSSDEWKDTETRPDLIINDEGSFDSIAFLADQASVTGTVWNEWETTWSGTPQTKTTRSTVTEHQDVHAQKIRQVTTTLATTRQDVQETRTGIRTNIISTTISKNLGDRVISVNYIPFIRTKDVLFEAKRLKPQTRLFPFFDGVNVASFVSLGNSYSSVNTVLNGTPLITNENGSVTGTFRIPNSEELKFKTGERIFRLTDKNDDSALAVGTSAEATYRAQGLLETKQATILSTRVPEFVRETVVETRNTTRISTQVSTTQGAWYDPLAQTFLIGMSGGVFVTKIELYFYSKSATIPITLQIRNTTNGYPSNKIVPFSEVTLMPAQVNISSDASIPTIFEFESPIYLSEECEYAFVILSDSNDYNVWIARIGELSVGSNRTISEQPYNGVLFKSQNASTWTPDQTADIKFTIYRALFDISKNPVVAFVNEDIENRTLRPNPIFLNSSSSKARIQHKNHGYKSGDSVTLSGVTGTSNLLGGIADTLFNNTHTIIGTPQFDSYVINLSSSAETTGYFGGEEISATQQRQMDVAYYNVQQLIFPQTAITWQHKTTPKASGTIDVLATSVDVNSTLDFLAPQIVKTGNSLNLQGRLSSDVDNLSPVIDNERLSAFVIGNRIDNLTESNGNISGIDDVLKITESHVLSFRGDRVLTDTTDVLTFASVNITSSNTDAIEFTSWQRGQLVDIITDGAVDNSHTNLRIANVSANILEFAVVTGANPFSGFTTATVGQSGTVVLTNNDAFNVLFCNTANAVYAAERSTVAETLKTLEPQKYIEIDSPSSENTGVYRVLRIASSDSETGVVLIPEMGGSDFRYEPEGQEVSVIQRDNFKEETAPRGGSASAKYITRQVVLNEPANSIKVILTMNQPLETEVFVYYRIQVPNDSTKFDDLPYIGFNSTLQNVDGSSDFSIEPTDNPLEFKEYTYTANTLQDFIALSIKIVMRSSDTTKIPRIRDFRAIATS